MATPPIDPNVDATVRTVVGEAGGESPLGQSAVAHVIANRAASGQISPLGVVSQKGQFESWNSPRVQSLQPSSPAYQRALPLVQDALSGKSPDPTGGAVSFINPELQTKLGRPMPAWADGSGTRIGAHVFYGSGSGAGAPSSDPTPPSVADILNRAQAAMASSGSRGPAGQSSPGTSSGGGASSAAPSGDMPTPPSVASILARVSPQERAAVLQGNSPPPPPGPHLTPGQAAATHAAAAQARPAELTDVYENSVLGNLRPVIDGGLMAAGTGIHNALAGVGIGQKLPYGMRDMYDAARSSEQKALDTYQQAHPIASTAANVAGFVSPGGVVPKVTDAAGHLLANVGGHALSSGAGRLVTHAFGNTVGGAVAGAGGATSEGQDPRHIAEAATAGGALGGALTPVGAIAGKVAKGAGRLAPLAGPAVGAAIGGAGGAAVGALSGVPIQAAASSGAQMGALAGLRLGGAKSTDPEIAPTSADTRSVIEHLKGQLPDADTLDQAHPAALTAEALGPAAPRIIKEATAGGGTASEDIQGALEARERGTGDRVVQSLKEAGAPDASTAGQDIEEATDAARKGPAKAAYTAALTGRGVYSPELQSLISTGPIRKALSRAYDTLGDAGQVANPDLPPPGTVQPQERMSVQDFNARAAEAAGKPAGSETTPADILNFIRTAKPDTFQLAPKAPSTVPTDEALDLAKKHLDRMAKAPGPDQFHYQQAARDFTAHLKSDAGLGEPYAKALSTAGDYLSNEESAEKGSKLWTGGKTAEDGATFAKRVAAETPAQRDFGLKGYLKAIYGDMDRGKFDPAKITQSPFHQRVLETYLGKEGAGKVMDSLTREAGFAKNQRGLMSAAKPVAAPPPHEDSGLLSAVLVGADHGFHPMAMARGYLTGSVAGGARKAISDALNRPMTNGERNALGKILAQPAKQTAAMLRQHEAMKKSAPLSSSVLKTLAERAKDAKKAFPAAVAATGQNAFHGLAVRSSRQAENAAF